MIGQYGYWIVLFGVMAESAGIPLPGETILIASGVLVQQGNLSLPHVLLFGVLGAIVGDQLGYWVGRKGGRPFVTHWGRYIRITPQRLDRAETFFERHGGKAVFLARFVAGLRVFGALTAGVSRMSWRTFTLYNALGGTTWATAAVFAGYQLGGSISLVERWVGRVSLLLAAGLVLAAGLYLAYRWIGDHPDKVRRVAERLGGRRVLVFLHTPTGLWLRRRFAPGEVYGRALTVGLGFFGLFAWAFGGITQDVLARDPLDLVDVSILHFFHSHDIPLLTAVVSPVEMVFSPEVLLLGALLAGSAMFLAGRRRGEFEKCFAGAVLVATAFGTSVLVEFFKHLFDRPRPPAALQLVTETGNGFPSGHAMTALVLGATVWYLFSLQPPESRWGSWRSKVRIGAFAAVIALAVGIGRVYTGAHYPSDMLAGWALGGVWASVCLTSAEVFRQLREDGKKFSESFVRTAIHYTQFSLVGGLNAAVDIGALNLLILIEPAKDTAQLVLYNAAALVLANVNSYLWNTLWTFRHRANHNARQVAIFVAQAAFNVAVGSLIFWTSSHLLVSYTGLPSFLGSNIAKVVSMIVASTISFLILRNFVFRKAEV